MKKKIGTQREQVNVKYTDVSTNYIKYKLVKYTY